MAADLSCKQNSKDTRATQLYRVVSSSVSFVHVVRAPKNKYQTRLAWCIEQVAMRRTAPN
jgi:hypothetical protein